MKRANPRTEANSHTGDGRSTIAAGKETTLIINPLRKLIEKRRKRERGKAQEAYGPEGEDARSWSGTTK
ncbi:hypothetical protein HPP92_002664 [Vanilla planifolia]|uniref:Uncharacterized protein n=1 Tax=Vanilla planifolia TaxID=51239 RepID=A0A835SF24_VANPL|nr:hypothetical protein HPP92_002664 [Vanilla planifolia]